MIRTMQYHICMLSVYEPAAPTENPDGQWTAIL